MLTSNLAKAAMAVILAAVIFIGVGKTPAGRVAAACNATYSCTLEHTSTSSVAIYEAQCNCYITWYWILKTFNEDGIIKGAYKHYEMTVTSNGLGAGAPLVAPYVRVWVCGGYKGEWSHLKSYTYGSTVVSPEYYYGGSLTGCYRQADDGASPNQGPSYVQGTDSWYPPTVSQYINQG